MKKEKKVRTYQRRTKSGKTITVRAHTASYEAADKAKEAAKKKGAGDEFSSKVKKGEEWKLPMNEFLEKLKEERAKKREDEKPKKVEDEKPKKKSEKTEKKTSAKKTTKKRTVGTGTNGPEPKKKATTKKTATKADTSEPAFTRDEFKEWYRGTGSAADKKVAKALRKQLGRSGYRKFEDEAIDNYTSRGHLSMFKRVSGGSSASAKAKSASVSTKVTTKVKGDRNFYLGTKSSKASSKSLAKRWDSTPPNDKMDAKARKADAPKSEAEFVKRLKNEAGKSRGVGSIFNSGTTTYRGSDYDLYKKRGTYYAVNRKTGKLASEKSTNLIVKNWESAAKGSKKETSPKKRSVGTGTNGPEPKSNGGFTEKQLRAYGRKLVNARNKYIGGPGPDSYRRALKKRQEALAEYHKTDEGKAMRSAYRSYVSKKARQWEKKYAERAAAKKLEDAKRYIAEHEKKTKNKKR